ncbi:MAG TPA: hypothetical protein ACFCUC_06955, partial [Desulfobacterales bacterium]
AERMLSLSLANPLFSGCFCSVYYPTADCYVKIDIVKKRGEKRSAALKNLCLTQNYDFLQRCG